MSADSLTSFRDLQVLVKYMAEKSAAVVQSHRIAQKAPSAFTGSSFS